MKEEDFLSLLNEIEAMSIEEYNEYHKEAQKMRESCFYIQDSFIEYELTEIIDNQLVDSHMITKSNYVLESSDISQTIGDDNIWPTAA